MNPDDLLTIAEHLASGGVRPQPGRPKQAEICRAVSATYYALFHTLAHDAANLLVGDRTSMHVDDSHQPRGCELYPQKSSRAATPLPFFVRPRSLMIRTPSPPSRSNQYNQGSNADGD